MNLSFAMTLDGLVRALRWKAHDLAESVERGYPASKAPADPTHPGETREADDDSRRR